jgi:hypothetical protein
MLDPGYNPGIADFYEIFKNFQGLRPLNDQGNLCDNAMEYYEHYRGA